MLKDIKNKNLFREQAYINGSWHGAISGDVIKVTNPADNAEIGSVPNCGKAETVLAIESASKAFKTWSTTAAKYRSDILKRWHLLIQQNAKDLALIMTTEQGKPIAESEGEIAYGNSFVEWFAEEARRTYGDIMPKDDNDRRLLVIKQAVGVVGAITPWNFPSAMITRKASAALAAGCTVVIKPASETPFSALALCQLAEEAGMPKGVINVVTGKPKEIGLELTTNPEVRKITFTGSTEVGKLLLSQSSSTVKKVSMELGGHAPFIVFDDADIDSAANGAIMSKFRNTGQTCVCANRIFVHEDVHDRFLKLFVEKVKQLKVGNGLDKSVSIGPLIGPGSVEKIKSQIKDAVDKGAKIEAGGSSHKMGGNFFEPTVISNANSKMTVTHEETFAPLAPIYKFKSEEEVVKMANDSNFGLAAYCYTSNLGRAWRMSESLEYGIVSVNTGIFSSPVAPFGGVKESGFGKEGSKYGIEDFMTVKYICMAGI